MSIQPSLGFRSISLYEGQEVRPYFVIGAEGLTEDQVKALQKDVGECGAEAVIIQNLQRKDFNLSKTFQGVALLVQKHVAGDHDHQDYAMVDGENVKLSNAGFNMIETYNMIRPVTQGLPIDPQAIPELNQIIQLIHNGEAFIPGWVATVSPQLEGTEKVLEIFKKSIAKPEEKSKSKSSDEAMSRTLQLEEVTLGEKDRHDNIASLQAMLSMVSPEDQHLVLKQIADLSASAAVSAPAPICKTQVIIRCEVSAGRALFIRGEGAGLSWDKGVLLQRGTEPNTWLFELPAGQQQPVQYKLLLDDHQWEQGDNHTTTYGKTTEHRPNF